MCWLLLSMDCHVASRLAMTDSGSRATEAVEHSTPSLRAEGAAIHGAMTPIQGVWLRTMGYPQIPHNIALAGESAQLLYPQLLGHAENDVFFPTIQFGDCVGAAVAQVFEDLLH